jgi:hypothetical protein
VAVLTALQVVPEGTYLTIGDLELAWNEVFDASTPSNAAVHLDLSAVTYVDQECLPYLLALLAGRRGLVTEITLPAKDEPTPGQADESNAADPKLGQVTEDYVPFNNLLSRSRAAYYGDDLYMNRSQVGDERVADRDRPVDFLYAWGLPRAVREVTGRNFEEYLTPRSRERFLAVDPNDIAYIKVMETPYDGRQSMLPETFFALTPIELKEGAAGAASIVTARWLDAHIVSVLDLYFKNLGSRIASYILHEGVLNAARHPGAKRAYTSAQVMYKWYPKNDVRGGSIDEDLGVRAGVTTQNPDARRNYGKGVAIEGVDSVGIPRQLVVSIWDDGHSFVATLGSALEKFGGVVSRAWGAEEDEFDVFYVDRDTGLNRRIDLVSKGEIAVSSPEERIVSAFMLGITSTPNEGNSDRDRVERLRHHEPSILPQGVAGHAGLGLHLIRRNVIDLLGGSIQYVSGGYRLFLHGAGEFGSYKGFLSKRDALGPRAEGNLLVVRIPLMEN